ncbi:hypothetical protein WN55_00112 [Dufourea novaeangliae]|uniref:Uncharacterized protein n=1 Tax=Dufourea novaeangliae TaxID=178035 RepID=A0A154NWK5_DUFNO|nr:hypothetical protein WN55_00112 [Dufourea novaeangliae]
MTTDPAKDTKYRETEADSEPRSYAQMIASYSETIYSRSGFGAAKDSMSSTMINGIHRSPFSTASMVSIKSLHAIGPSILSPDTNLHSETSPIYSNYPNADRKFIDTVGGDNDEPERTVSSYATMIEKYSNSTYPNNDSRGWRNGLVPIRHVSTKLDSVSMMSVGTESVRGKPDEVVESDKKNISNGLTEARREETLKKRENRQVGWMAKVEDIIKDLKRITAKKDDTGVTSHEKWMLLSVNERAHWLDRVVNAHKKRIKDRKLPTGGTVAEHVDTNESIVSPKTTIQSEQKGDRLQTEMSGNKPSNPMAEYIRRGPTGSSSQRGATSTNNSSQSPTTAATTSTKEPQIELRMTPSHNESVVAINVDEVTTRTTGAAKDRLSVVISSRKNNVGNMDRANQDARSDFGSMQISISEDTVPVKQIEFSINGKPVSELKSIVARADKLDVVSSMDQVEIRIPSRDRVANQQTQNVARVMSHPSAVLNLHINAKFNEPRIQRPRDTGLKPESNPPTPRTTPPPTQPPVPPKPQHLFSPTSLETNGLKSLDTSVSSTAEKSESVVGNEQGKVLFASGVSSPVESKELIVAETNLTKEKINSDVRHSISSAVDHTRENSSQEPTTNTRTVKQDDSMENREPSNMIPWWSSENPFRKIKKKENIPEKASTFENKTIAPEQLENAIRQSEGSDPGQKTGQTLQPDVVVIDHITDSVKIATSGKDVEKKLVTDPKKSSELSDVHVVRVRSPQKWVTMSPISAVKAPKHAKSKSFPVCAKLTKKVKYRTRNILRTFGAPKPSSDTSINPVPPSKTDKHMTIDPQTVDVGQEAKKADDEQRKRVEDEPKRYQATENVQNSDTVFKATDLEKSANRSAGVSAKPPSAAGESGLEDGKGKNGIVGRVSSEGTKVADGVLDERMKQILKNMKPIEKRKDGTLIDYGMTVPSRIPAEKTRRARTPVNKNHNVTSKDKIIEPVKISSVKKETLSEPDMVTGPVIIVEPVKVTSVKKATPAEPKTVSSQSEINESKKIPLAIKLTEKGPKSIPYQLRVDADKPSSASKSGPDAIVQSRKTQFMKIKKAFSDTQNRDADRTSKAQDTLNTANSSQGRPNAQHSENFPKSKEIKTPKSTLQSSKRNDSKKIPLKGQERGPLERTIVYNPKPSEEHAPNDFYPPKSKVTTKKYEEKSPARVDKRPKVTGTAPLEGTIRYEPPMNNLANFSSVSEETRGEMESTGLNPSRSSTMRSKTSKHEITPSVASSIEEKQFVEKNKTGDVLGAEHCQPYLRENSLERPEKGLLYSSWLQRFKNRVDDDTIL